MSKKKLFLIVSIICSLVITTLLLTQPVIEQRIVDEYVREIPNFEKLAEDTKMKMIGEWEWVDEISLNEKIFLTKNFYSFDEQKNTKDNYMQYTWDVISDEYGLQLLVLREVKETKGNPTDSAFFLIREIDSNNEKYNNYENKYPIGQQLELIYLGEQFSIANDRGYLEQHRDKAIIVNLKKIR